jgi:hypothetical protein
MAPEASRLVRRATLALMVLASAATEVAAGDRRALLTSLGLAGLWGALAAVLARFVPAGAPARRTNGASLRAYR